MVLFGLLSKMDKNPVGEEASLELDQCNFNSTLRLSSYGTHPFTFGMDIFLLYKLSKRKTVLEYY